jgi:hypothetical protein
MPVARVAVKANSTCKIFKGRKSMRSAKFGVGLLIFNFVLGGISPIKSWAVNIPATVETDTGTGTSTDVASVAESAADTTSAVSKSLPSASYPPSGPITLKDLLGYDPKAAQPATSVTAPAATSAEPVTPSGSAVPTTNTTPTTDITTSDKKTTPNSKDSKSKTTDKSASGAMAMSAMASGGAAGSPQNVINNFHVDPSSGTGAISLPIYTPPGRKGLQPGVGLTYSHRGGNGPFGFGWQVDFGYIERSTKKGPPSFGSSDSFVCSLGGGTMELVSLGNNE